MTIETIQQAMATMGAPYYKTERQLTMLAMRHWEEWRPKMVAKMKENDTLIDEAQRAAKRTFKQIKELMAQGYQNHEAEEVVMQRYILLKPEQEVIDEMERE